MTHARTWTFQAHARSNPMCVFMFQRVGPMHFEVSVSVSVSVSSIAARVPATCAPGVSKAPTGAHPRPTATQIGPSYGRTLHSLGASPPCHVSWPVLRVEPVWEAAHLELWCHAPTAFEQQHTPLGKGYSPCTNRNILEQRFTLVLNHRSTVEQRCTPGPIERSSKSSAHRHQSTHP